MRIRLILPLLGLYLLASCRRSEPESFALVGGSSSAAPGGHYAIRAYKYQKGDRLAVVGFVERPGAGGAGPACVALFRLPNRDLSLNEIHSGAGDAGAHVSWEYRFAPAGGADCKVGYELKGESAAEHWSIDGKSYAVDAGRVALVDLTKNPPEMTQVRVDLANLFPTTEPNQEQMKAGLDKLRERDEGVRKFLDPGR
jgi:hypothetical protein